MKTFGQWMGDVVDAEWVIVPPRDETEHRWVVRSEGNYYTERGWASADYAETFRDKMNGQRRTREEVMLRDAYNAAAASAPYHDYETLDVFREESWPALRAMLQEIFEIARVLAT